MHVCADTNAYHIVLHIAKLILNAPSDSRWIYENVDVRKKMAKGNEFGENKCWVDIWNSWCAKWCKDGFLVESFQTKNGISIKKSFYCVKFPKNYWDFMAQIERQNALLFDILSHIFEHSQNTADNENWWFFAKFSITCYALIDWLQAVHGMSMQYPGTLFKMSDCIIIGNLFAEIEKI